MAWVSTEERMARTRLLVDVLTDDDELKLAGRTVSIDDAMIARGATLVAAAQARIDEQIELEIAWDTVRTQRKALRDEVIKTYMQHRRVAKAGIESADVKKLLDLAGERHTTVVEQHAQMTTFYTKGLSNAAALKELNRLGITREMLETGRTKLAQILSLLAQEKPAQSKKDEAFDPRDAALDALDAWYDEVMKGLEYATRANPAMMGRVKA